MEPGADPAQTWLYGGIAGAAVVALIGGAAAAWPPKDKPRWVEGVTEDALPIGALRSGLLIPLAFGIAAPLAIYGALGGFADAFPPTTAAERLALAALFVAMVALMGGLIVPTLGPRVSSGWALTSALAAATGIAVVAGSQPWAGQLAGVRRLVAIAPEGLRDDAVALGPVLIMTLTGLWALAGAWGTARLAQNGLRVASCVVLIGLAVGVAVAMLGNGSTTYPRFGLGAAVITAALVALPLAHPRARVPGAAIACACALLGVLAVMAFLYLDTFPLWLVFTLGLVPLAGVGADWLLQKRGAGPGARTAAAMAAAAALALASVAPGVKSLLTWDKTGEYAPR